MVLIDTNIFIYYLKNENKIAEYFNNLRITTKKFVILS
jgi:predicted nucleic acid-binding protein